jgi:hypothetical protein
LRIGTYTKQIEPVNFLGYGQSVQDIQDGWSFEPEIQSEQDKPSTGAVELLDEYAVQ